MKHKQDANWRVGCEKNLTRRDLMQRAAWVLAAAALPAAHAVQEVPRVQGRALLAGRLLKLVLLRRFSDLRLP